MKSSNFKKKSLGLSPKCPISVSRYPILHGGLKICILIIVCLATSCTPKYSQGKMLYEAQCANCHGKEGEGLKSLYPPLKNSSFLTENLNILPCIIRFGLDEELLINNRVYTTKMEGLPHLSEIEITNITNFILSSWYDNMQYISLDEVKFQIEECN